MGNTSGIKQQELDCYGTVSLYSHAEIEHFSHREECAQECIKEKKKFVNLLLLSKLKLVDFVGLLAGPSV
jgi:hypothetical protein